MSDALKPKMQDYLPETHLDTFFHLSLFLMKNPPISGSVDVLCFALFSHLILIPLLGRKKYRYGKKNVAHKYHGEILSFDFITQTHRSPSESVGCKALFSEPTGQQATFPEALRAGVGVQVATFLQPSTACLGHLGANKRGLF